MISQKEITLPSFPRGFHLITDHIIRHIDSFPESGLLHVFLKHTSAGLTINENADPDVRMDLNSFIDKIVPENQPFVRHILEGSDDMPAHVKTSLVGIDLTIPVKGRRLQLGTWQGIYLCEFRNYGGGRKLLLTLYS